MRAHGVEPTTNYTPPEGSSSVAPTQMDEVTVHAQKPHIMDPGSLMPEGTVSGVGVSGGLTGHTQIPSISGAPNSGTNKGGTGKASPLSSTIFDPNISPEGKALLDTIATRESGGQYNIRQGGSHFTDMSRKPTGVGPGGVSSAPANISLSTRLGQKPPKGLA